MKGKKDQPEEYTGDILQNQFTAYVEKALKNNRISYYRKQQAKQRNLLLYASEEEIPLHIHETASDHDSDISDIHNQVLLGALHLLSENDLTIIRLRVIYGHPYKKISGILGITPEAAESRYRRAIARLRKRLEGLK